MSGWVKLHRKIVDWEWYDHIPTRIVFLHFLLTVNYEDSKYQGHDIPAGSKVCGYEALSKETGVSVQQARTAISNLKSTGTITVKKTHKFSIISISNWGEYQANNSPATSNQQAINKP